MVVWRAPAESGKGRGVRSGRRERGGEGVGPVDALNIISSCGPTLGLNRATLSSELPRSLTSTFSLTSFVPSCSLKRLRFLFECVWEEEGSDTVLGAFGRHKAASPRSGSVGTHLQGNRGDVGAKSEVCGTVGG